MPCKYYILLPKWHPIKFGLGSDPLPPPLWKTSLSNAGESVENARDITGNAGESIIYFGESFGNAGDSIENARDWKSVLTKQNWKCSNRCIN